MKLIMVEDCGHCPYRYTDFSFEEPKDICIQTHQEVEDRREIPEWCPLSEMY